MHWLNSPIGSAQAYYRKGRTIREVKRSEIDGVCSCGYITLTEAAGGFTVKRSNVRIIDDETGAEIKVLRRRKTGREGRYGPIYDFNKYWQCNACVNDWK